MIKTYSELIRLSTYEERLDYLKLSSMVADPTFGSNRYFNQIFYTSKEWKTVRREVIFRDNGNDLGIEGCEVVGKILIHHMNPITIEDISDFTDSLFDLDNLITTSAYSHDYIHFGKKQNSASPFEERKRGDTILW